MSIMRRLGLLLAAAALAGTLGSCGGDGSEDRVGPRNAQPVLTAIPDQVITVGQTIETPLSATDTDGDQLSFTIPTGPGFMSIRDVQQTGNTATATCLLTPAQEGEYGAVVRVDDGRGGFDSQTFSITVEAASGPAPGVWQGSAGFGRLELTVNSQGSAITRIVHTFQNFRCGGVSRSGTITVSSPSGWEIVDGHFTIHNDWSAINLEMTVEGTFSSSTAASGTWTAESYGATCSGNWTASH